MQHKVNASICSLWTFQSLTLCIISLVLYRIQGAITTQTEDVELGSNTTLRCTSTEPIKNFFQVTWRKVINGNSENMGTYRNGTDANILPQFKGKFSFTILKKNDTAITLWNVSNKDKGCYQCIFSTTVGELRGEPCFSIYGLETFLHRNIFDGRLNATCVATGFPRPNVSWVAQGGKQEETEITNPNGTISVISNILMSIDASSGHVGEEVICRVTHRGKEIDIKVAEKGRSYPNAVLLTVLALFLVTLVIIVACCWRQYRKKRSGF
ncbi:OX-2 membrane glycoprotein-like [Elgaria multicarinata webbii]|uniref:OX-2 membrane glycoprotein-like n=1 Tax=Elgaria multicarinata webbii TaxID=159646 RepID=UPI002FCCF545